MARSSAVRNLERFCRQWSEQPDEARQSMLLELIGPDRDEAMPDEPPSIAFHHAGTS